eukprot:6266627-Alexandrium_andersonii.AAC.1
MPWQFSPTPLLASQVPACAVATAGAERGPPMARLRDPLAGAGCGPRAGQGVAGAPYGRAASG